jgi:Putative DNA-binding domain
MPGPGDWQNEFASALIGPNLDVPPGLIHPMGEPSPKRFAVYRNNVIRGLVEALKDTFPAVCRIVGEEFFEAMARIYALQNPPRSPILLEYGSGFADFVETFEPAASVPYLSDVARIERAWLEAYHAVDASPMNADELYALSYSDILNLHLTLHPSVRLVQSRYPALTIWSTNVEGAVPIPVDLEAGGEEVLIVRTGPDVEARSLTRAAMEFVTALSGDSTISDATRLALGIDPDFSLGSALRNLIETDIVVEFRTESSPSSLSKRSKNEER